MRAECADCEGTGNIYRNDEDGNFLACETCRGTGSKSGLACRLCDQKVPLNTEGRHEWVGSNGGKYVQSCTGAEPAAVETPASENTHKDSACSECSRLASRVEELEALLIHAATLDQGDYQGRPPQGNDVNA